MIEEDRKRKRKREGDRVASVVPLKHYGNQKLDQVMQRDPSSKMGRESVRLQV